MNKYRRLLPLLILFIAAVVGEFVNTLEAAGTIHIKGRFIQRITDPAEEQLEKNSSYATADWSVPLDQVALFCLDIWNMDVHQDMHERDDRITRERIVPLVASARASGLQVIHAPCPAIARHYPDRLPHEEDANTTIDSDKSPDWPPPAFVKRTGEFARFASPETPYRESLSRIFRDKLDFHPQVRPVGDEPVVATGEELHRLCAQRGILLLLYAGFHTPGCMITRTYGITEMRDRGFLCILLRDCTNGMETRETFEHQMGMKTAVAFLEFNGIYTMNSTQVIAALKDAHQE